MNQTPITWEQLRTIVGKVVVIAILVFAGYLLGSTVREVVYDKGYDEGFLACWHMGNKGVSNDKGFIIRYGEQP